MAVAEGPLAQCPPQGQRQLPHVLPPRSLSNGRPRPARAVVSASLAGVVGAAPVVAPLRRGAASRSRELVKSNARTRTGTLRAIPVLDQVPWGVSGLLPRTPKSPRAHSHPLTPVPPGGDSPPGPCVLVPALSGPARERRRLCVWHRFPSPRAPGRPGSSWPPVTPQFTVTSPAGGGVRCAASSRTTCFSLTRLPSQVVRRLFWFSAARMRLLSTF